MINPHKTYYLHVSIPFCDIAEYLSDADFQRYQGHWDNIGIDLHFDYRKADPPVGIREGMDYRGHWSVPLVGNYPDAIKDAVDKFIDTIDVEDKYEKQALDLAYD